uniref:Uncharacterized protein n=1 Tax=Salix viminalis TaxID=40686 RepID=A0A6N2NLB1_SALVM
MILAKCSSYYDASGLMKEMDDRERNTFEQIIHDKAANSLRCIAFAHQQISEDQYEDGKEDKTLREDCLTLLGLVGIKDPCRPGHSFEWGRCVYNNIQKFIQFQLTVNVAALVINFSRVQQSVAVGDPDYEHIGCSGSSYRAACPGANGKKPCG